MLVKSIKPKYYRSELIPCVFSFQPHAYTLLAILNHTRHQVRDLYQLGNNDAAMAYRYPLLVCIICRYCTTFVNIQSIRSPDAERSPTPIVICIDQQWVNYVGMYTYRVYWLASYLPISCAPRHLITLIL